MIVWYLLMECLGTIIALFLWVGTMGGYFMHSRSSQRMHALVQYLWASSLLIGVRLFFNARIIFPDCSVFNSGPLLIAAQHSSFFDALLPTVLLGKGGGSIVPRHVLKSGLLLSPSLDFYGNRLPNKFVGRSSTTHDLDISGVYSIGKELHKDACVIFPEGTFYSPKRFTKAIEKLQVSDPERSGKVAQLNHLLPLKPGGILALLSSAPNADLIMIGHYGLSSFGSFKEIINNIPFQNPIEIYVKRIPSSSLPSDTSSCLKFIDNEWLNIDNWLQSKIRNYDCPN
ncbi:MAG TPA: hypothetical protein QF850_04090 [Acidimicrobiales bacterium]|nr:hypothetical protein [Acidimicrobiales bacterium]